MSRGRLAASAIVRSEANDCHFREALAAHSEHFRAQTRVSREAPAVPDPSALVLLMPMANDCCPRRGRVASNVINS